MIKHEETLTIFDIMEKITIKEEPELLDAIKKNGNDVIIRKGHQQFGRINGQTLQASYWEIEIPEQDFYNSLDIWNNNYILKQKKSQFVKWQDEEEKEKAIQMAEENNKPKYYVSATNHKRIIKEIEFVTLKIQNQCKALQKTNRKILKVTAKMKLRMIH